MRLNGAWIEPARIAAVVVGTGPGAFTGLRVGIATAKGLAHALRRPIIGISTADALLADAPEGGQSCCFRPDRRTASIHMAPGGAPACGGDPGISTDTPLRRRSRKTARRQTRLSSRGGAWLGWALRSSPSAPRG